MIGDYERLALITEALRRQASDQGGALRLDRHMTDILLQALDTLALKPERHVALMAAVARGDVVNLADRRMARDWSCESGPEDAA